jgi:hypothetical protein
VPPFSNSAPRKGGVASNRVAASLTPSRAESISSMVDVIGAAMTHDNRKSPHPT